MDTNNWRPAQGAESTMDTNDWRAQLPPESRQRIVNKIMDTLKSHGCGSGEEELLELRKIAQQFEDKVYTTATSQSDYLGTISLKMLKMETTKSQDTMANSMPSNPDMSNNPLEVDFNQPLPSSGSHVSAQMLDDRTGQQVKVAPIDNPFQKRKRTKRSEVWLEFSEVVHVDGTKKAKCNHCQEDLAMLKSGCTTHLKRHIESCLRRKLALKSQALLKFQPVDSFVNLEEPLSAITDGRFDMSKMRESIAIWVLMHEHPFKIVEERGFNMMQIRGMPEWSKISRESCKTDCEAVYEMERGKLKIVLQSVNKISLTTDLWKAKNQQVEYMVLTGHWIDTDWKLQKRVLNFIHLEPPHHGIEISDAIFKCLIEWGIENKVYTISVDNSSDNDAAIESLRKIFLGEKNLLYDGKLFHVRCCAHILNIMVQYGLEQINDVIHNVHESVRYFKDSEARLKIFTEIVQQLQLPTRKLILDCKTHWNSTYEMLSNALQFKDVFPRYKERDAHYLYCPSEEDWEKCRKVCSILEVFYTATRIFSGSEYPTSNLFLHEVYPIKEMLDKRSEDKDEFIQSMVLRMKQKFDKYWGECNLLMSVAAVLDPRCKMKVIRKCFRTICPPFEAKVNILKVRDTLYDLYAEYVALQNSEINELSSSSGSNTSTRASMVSTHSPGWSRFNQFLPKVKTVQPQKSELDIYLEEGVYICEADGPKFDALSWWKGNDLKYRILSKMARDILAIPITTVASESTFSAGTRVIDKYRAKLAVKTVQVLICGSDWCRTRYGEKKKSVQQKRSKEITLPIP